MTAPIIPIDPDDFHLGDPRRARCQAEARTGRCTRAAVDMPTLSTRDELDRVNLFLCTQHLQLSGGTNGIVGPDGSRWFAPEPGDEIPSGWVTINVSRDDDAVTVDGVTIHRLVTESWETFRDRVQRAVSLGFRAGRAAGGAVRDGVRAVRQQAAAEEEIADLVSQGIELGGPTELPDDARDGSMALATEQRATYRRRVGAPDLDDPQMAAYLARHRELTPNAEPPEEDEPEPVVDQRKAWLLKRVEIFTVLLDGIKQGDREPMELLEMLDKLIGVDLPHGICGRCGRCVTGELCGGCGWRADGVIGYADILKLPDLEARGVRGARADWVAVDEIAGSDPTHVAFDSAAANQPGDYVIVEGETLERGEDENAVDFRDRVQAAIDRAAQPAGFGATVEETTEAQPELNPLGIRVEFDPNMPEGEVALTNGRDVVRERQPNVTDAVIAVLAEGDHRRYTVSCPQCAAEWTLELTAQQVAMSPELQSTTCDCGFVIHFLTRDDD